MTENEFYEHLARIPPEIQARLTTFADVFREIERRNQLEAYQQRIKRVLWVRPRLSRVELKFLHDLYGRCLEREPSPKQLEWFERIERRPPLPESNDL